MRTLTRRSAIASGCSALMYAACSPFTTGRGDRTQLLVIGAWHVGGFEPAVGGQLYCMMQIAETLVETDGQGRPLPGLATAWQVSPSGTSWRFTLRRGVTFHDGEQLRPEHVARVLNRARTRPGVLRVAPIEDIAAHDDAIEVRLSRPFSPLPSLLAHFSTQILAPSAFTPDDRVAAIVGTGPFTMVSAAPPQRMDVERHESWHGRRPPIRAARYLSVSRAETRALLAEGAQADLVYDLDAATIDRLLPKLGTRMLTVTNPRSVIMLVNCGHRFLSDVRARRAISLALDRDGIARGIFRSAALAGTQLFPPTLAGWHVPGLPPLRRDLEDARRLLEDVGWSSEADGILVRGGDRFELTLKTYPDRAELPVLAAAVQDQLRALGIALSVEVGNSGDIPHAHRDGSLELALASRNYAASIEPTATMLEDFGAAGGDWGAMNWSEPGLADAFAALTAANDLDVQRHHQADIATRIHIGLPIIPIAWSRQGLAVGPRIVGASLDPIERTYRIADVDWAPDRGRDA